MLLDFDSTKSYRLFQERYPKIAHLVKKMVILATRPGGHYHVYILLKQHHRFVNLSALAVYLGSDIRRENSNLSRIMAGATKPILLVDYIPVPHWRPADISCLCPPRWKGRKLGTCIHMREARGHRSAYGHLSTRLKIVGVKDPYGHA